MRTTWDTCRLKYSKCWFCKVPWCIKWFYTQDKTISKLILQIFVLCVDKDYNEVMQVASSEQKRRILGVVAKEISHVNSEILVMMRDALAKMSFLYSDFVNNKVRQCLNRLLKLILSLHLFRRLNRAVQNVSQELHSSFPDVVLFWNMENKKSNKKILY